MITHVYVVTRNIGYGDQEVDVFTDHDASRRWYDRLGGVDSEHIWEEQPILDRQFAEITPLPPDLA